MANKRMFDKAIIDTDAFMDMPLGSKALYFLLGMEADDEGFVSHKKVMRVHGGNQDDLKLLVAKEFLIMFESGIVVITDWNSNNWLNSNRIRETTYKHEKSQLILTQDKKYVLSNRLASIEEYRVEEKPAVSKETGLSPKKDDGSGIVIARCDEHGNELTPRKAKAAAKPKVFEHAALCDEWVRLASKSVGQTEEFVGRTTRGLNFAVANCMKRDGLDRDGMVALFKFFLADERIKRDDKLAFALCLSAKYVSKFLLNKNRPMTLAQISGEIKL